MKTDYHNCNAGLAKIVADCHSVLPNHTKPAIQSLGKADYTGKKKTKKKEKEKDKIFVHSILSRKKKKKEKNC